MNRALLYVSAAAVIGLLIVVVPTWFSLMKTDPQGMLSEHYSGGLPLLRDLEKGSVEAVSIREVGVFGLGLAGALVVYVVVRRGISNARDA